MAPVSQLLGPPEIHLLPPPPAAADGGVVDNPIQSIVSQTHNLELSETEDKDSDEEDSMDYVDDENPPMGLTENLYSTFLSTGNPCLDFFFHVVPDTPPKDLIGRLELAWAHYPLTTLKLICNLRAVRGTGKSDKESFYTAAFWLHNHHPKILACNAQAFADFGYFKDLLEILYRILGGPDEEEKKVVVKAAEEVKEEREKARVLRKEREVARARKALEMYDLDVNYQFLHDRNSDLFAELLKSDIENLNSGKLNKISLAAKWCPTIDSSYDKSTLICESIAKKLFPRNSDPQFEGLEEGHYVYRIRDKLRKQVLVPLHKALELPEVFMSANEWNSLPYNRVPLVAMKNYKKLFLKHDNDRFKEYLQRVTSGKAKIAAGALLPHEIIAALSDGDGGEVAELQWKRMVDDLMKKGKLSIASRCVMYWEAWRGFPWSADPELHIVEGDTLLAKIEFVKRMDWGMNTNFQKVFDRILKVAVEGKLREEQLIKRVFVFSDMEFDVVCGSPWETDYQAIKKKFGEKGYENVPEIVFWNLRSSQSPPVVARQSGVALVSGFLKNLLTMFLDSGGIVNPLDVMELAISGDEYKQLLVYD
ncbi:hypothetical protein ACSBR1_031517 [Camellia fascicularis]